jgi:hypothetical protein
VRFLEIFFKEKKTQLNENISVQEFYDYFRNLSDSNNTNTDPESENYCNNQFCYDDPIFAELDSVITTDEVRHAISCLKRGKAGGSDDIINEYCIETCDSTCGHLRDIFNVILSTGHFPNTWME